MEAHYEAIFKPTAEKVILIARVESIGSTHNIADVKVAYANKIPRAIWQKQKMIL